MFTGPNIVTNGLVLALDAANTKSYPGSGTTWNDVSGNSNNGTLTNGPTFNSANGGSIVFDGVDDYINVPYNTVLNTPSGATYEIWFKPTIFTSGEFLNRGTSDSGATPDNPRFYIYNTGQIYFDWSSPSVDTYAQTTTGAVTMGTWNQIVGIATPNTALRIFANGYETSYSLQIQTLPATLPNTSNPIQIGGATWLPRYFTGNIASVKLYNRTLIPSEVLQNYQALKTRFGL
jgi:hypothetical protein